MARRRRRNLSARIQQRPKRAPASAQSTTSHVSPGRWQAYVEFSTMWRDPEFWNSGFCRRDADEWPDVASRRVANRCEIPVSATHEENGGESQSGTSQHISEMVAAHGQRRNDHGSIQEQDRNEEPARIA